MQRRYFKVPSRNGATPPSMQVRHTSTSEKSCCQQYWTPAKDRVVGATGNLSLRSHAGQENLAGKRESWPDAGTAPHGAVPHTLQDHRGPQRPRGRRHAADAAAIPASSLGVWGARTCGRGTARLQRPGQAGHRTVDTLRHTHGPHQGQSDPDGTVLSCPRPVRGQGCTPIGMSGASVFCLRGHADSKTSHTAAQHAPALERRVWMPSLAGAVGQQGICHGHVRHPMTTCHDHDPHHE